MGLLLENSIAEFERLYGGKPEHGASAPGRVNLIGGHTDYNQGFALPIAIEKKIYTLWRKRDDSLVRAKSSRVGNPVEFHVRNREITGGWEDGLKGAIALLENQGGRFAGMDILISGDIPLKAGLSSSAAFIVSALLALSVNIEKNFLPVEISLLAQKVENEFLGVECGILDQMAITAGKEGHALFLDCLDLSYKHIPLSGDFGIVVCHTGITRTLASSKYNQRRAECEKGLEFIMSKKPNVKSLRDVSLSDLNEFIDEMGKISYNRLHHVILENRRVLLACQALKNGDGAAFGKLVCQSHESLRDRYDVSCAELNLMVDLALEEEGCYGGRLIGAGFGGCAIAIVKKNRIFGFCQSMENRYKTGIGEKGLFIPVTSGKRASRLKFST